MSKDIIDALAKGENVNAETAFKDVMVQKVGTALETKRQELAKVFVKSNKEEEETDAEV